MYQVLLSGGVFDFETRTVVPPDRSSAAWQAYQAWLTAGNTPLPPDSVGQDSLADAKLKRQSEINAYAAGLRNVVVRGRSVGEMVSWSIKLAEARAFVHSADPLQAPTLAMICQIRGMTIAEMAGRVIAQSEPFLHAEAYIDGIRGKHCDAIEACAAVQDIVVYDWMAGWPVIPSEGV